MMKEKMKRVDSVSYDSHQHIDDHTNANEKKKKKGSSSSSSISIMKICQVENCYVDLSEAKAYNRRHKVCEDHSKAESVMMAGIRQRFCQQCSRFHEVNEFDEAKRSCRSRLAGHNERRRKNNNTNDQEGNGNAGSISQFTKGSVFDDQRGMMTQINFQEHTTHYNHFRIG